MTRIAYLCTDPGIPPDSTKGASVHFRSMGRALVAAGAELDAVMARKGAPFIESGLHVVRAPKGKGAEREAALMAFNDEVVAALEARGPYDAVYERLSTFGVAGARYATAQGIPLLLEVNAPMWIEAARYRDLHHVEAAKAMALETLGAASRIFAVSAELGRILESAGVQANKIEVVPNGVDEAVFAAAAPCPRPPQFGDRCVIVFVGSLKPWHGIEFLLEAFAQCEDLPAALWIVGDGTLRETVEAAAARSPATIHYAGAVDHTEIPAILKAADVSVAPYTSAAPTYFSPLKVIEALAVRCPLLVSDVRCVVDVLPEDADATRFAADDVASFRAAVAELCARPRGARPDALDRRWTWAGNAQAVLRALAMVLCAFTFVLAGCQNPDLSLQRSIRDLSPGMWIEVEGRRVDDESRAENIAELPRGKANDADKMEVRAQIEASGEDFVQILGHKVELVEKTKYETADRREVERFPLRPGDWIKVKLRIKDGGRLRARTIRQADARDQFDIEGELGRIDLSRQEVFVGPLGVSSTPQTRVRLVGEGDAQRDLDDPLALFFEDDQKSVPFTMRVTDWLLVGGQLTGEYRVDDEYDLDRTDRGDRQRTSAGGNLDLLWILDKRGSFGLLEGTYTRTDRYDSDGPDTTRERRGLSRAYVYYRVNDKLRFQVGRQDFDDDREWLYDEILDGARVYGSLGPIDLELSASAGRDFGSDEGNPTEETSMYAALARYRVNDDHRLTAYILERKDSGPTEFEPRLFGLRSFSRPSRGFGHWVELSRAEGRMGSVQIEGEAFDLGGTYRFDSAWSPTLYAGYAYARGEDTTRGKMGFRQTGLQDNNGRFGGVSTFRYYGELFEPELANIGITTFGVSVRPLPAWSLDVVAHTYRQDFKSNTIYSDNLRTTSNGVHATLGTELDVILAYRHGSLFRGELVYARFEPGSAFDKRDPAHRIEFQIRVGF